RIYDLGIYPDWWKLEPFATEAAYAKACAAIEANDAFVRGVVVLGLEAPEDELAKSLRLAAKFKLVRGFAVGRTIFAASAKAWLKGERSDAEVVADMAARYRRLCEIWDEARAIAL